MTFQEVLAGEVVVFALSGKIMAFDESTPLRTRIKEYIDSGKKNFVIDMADVPWMNSEGVGLLAATVTTVGKAGGKLVLANINEKIESVLIITKCNTIIKHYDSRQTAIESFSKTPADR